MNIKNIPKKDLEILESIGAEIIESINDKDIDEEKTSLLKEFQAIILLNNDLVIPINSKNPKASITTKIIKVSREIGSNKIKLISENIFLPIYSNIIKTTITATEISDPSAEVNFEIEEENHINSTAADKELESIIYNAKLKGASDIHILPKKESTEIKFRESGQLKLFKKYPKYYCKFLVNRVKTKAGLDITNRLIPQDGKFTIKFGKEVLELRVSTANTVFGENTVMRVQQTTNMFDIELDDIGFEDEDLKKYRKNFKEPYGMILNVGATGAGKTTTFYLTINELVKIFPDKGIFTAEDPVEIVFENAVQFEINEQKGLTFARVLKALLRQDPDIILIGEIRDEETSNIAIKAAMTGHLVLATLHATDAVNAIARLQDIGASSQQISAVVSCILSQRLTRKLCKCKQKYEMSQEIKNEYNIDFNYAYKAKGCLNCGNTGYKGRTAIMEVLELTEPIKKAISEKKTEVELKITVKDQGFNNLWKNGLKKLKRGDISLDELLLVLKPDVIYDLLEKK